MTGNHQEADDMAENEAAPAQPAAETVTVGADRAPSHPPGDYAIVEIMGHQTLVGRICEVTRFGAAMLHIEPIFAGALLPPVLQGGAAIYRLTPCPAAIAFQRAPKETQRWALPETIRATLPPALLPPPATERQELVVDEEAFLGDSADDEGDDDVDF